MNDLSIVSHIKNEMYFLEQFWKHIHSFEPREIVIIDTGSVDGTWEKLLELELHKRNNDIIYQTTVAFEPTARFACRPWETTVV